MKIENSNPRQERLQVSSAQAKVKEQLLRKEAEKAVKNLNSRNKLTQPEILQSLSALNRLPEIRYGRPVDFKKPGELEMFQALAGSIERALLLPEESSESQIPQTHFVHAIHDFYQKIEEVVAKVIYTTSPEEQSKINNNDGTYLFSQKPESTLGKHPIDLSVDKFMEITQAAMSELLVKKRNQKSIGSPQVLAELVRNYSTASDKLHSGYYDFIKDSLVVSEAASALDSLDRTYQESSLTDHLLQTLAREANKYRKNQTELDTHKADFIVLKIRKWQEKVLLHEQEALKKNKQPITVAFEQIRNSLLEGLKLTSKADFGFEDFEELHNLVKSLGKDELANQLSSLPPAKTTRLINLANALSSSFSKLKPLHDLPNFEELEEFSADHRIQLRAAIKNEASAKTKVCLEEMLESWNNFCAECKNIQDSTADQASGSLRKLYDLQDQVNNDRKKMKEHLAINIDLFLKDPEEVTERMKKATDFISRPKELLERLTDAVVESLNESKEFTDIADFLVPNYPNSESRQILWKDPQSVLFYLKQFVSTNDSNIKYLAKYLNTFVGKSIEKLSQSEDTLRATIQYLEEVNSKIPPNNAKAKINLEPLLKALAEKYPQTPTTTVLLPHTS